MARLAEQAQELLAALPAAPGAPSRRMRVAVFERTGEAWRVGCEPDVTLLRDSKGMAQLATLLASPGLPFAAVDLAGNGDGAGGPDGAERARLNVTRALRGAIRRVAAHDPALGRELDDAVRTGAQACYEPPAGGGTRWRVSP
jgi:hypothetical protein